MIKKKGVSPLIATILLLAFVISLIIFILNILPDGCKKLNVEIPKGEQSICYDVNKGQVKLALGNVVAYEVTSAKIIIFDKNGESVSSDFSEHIAPGETAEITIDYDKQFKGEFQKNKDGSIRMLIIPVYDLEGKPKECKSNIIVLDIPNCGIAE